MFYNFYVTQIRYKNYKLLCRNSIALGYFCATNCVAQGILMKVVLHWNKVIKKISFQFLFNLTSGVIMGGALPPNQNFAVLSFGPRILSFSFKF